MSFTINQNEGCYEKNVTIFRGTFQCQFYVNIVIAVPHLPKVLNGMVLKFVRASEFYND